VFGYIQPSKESKYQRFSTYLTSNTKGRPTDNFLLFLSFQVRKFAPDILSVAHFQHLWVFLLLFMYGFSHKHSPLEAKRYTRASLKLNERKSGQVDTKHCEKNPDFRLKVFMNNYQKDIYFIPGAKTFSTIRTYIHTQSHNPGYWS
jgi:hypothetical protein